MTELLAYDDTPAVERFVGPLAARAMRRGIPREVATTCSLSLADVTIGDAIRTVRAGSGGSALPTEAGAIGARLDSTIRWILAGVRAEAEWN